MDPNFKEDVKPPLEMEIPPGQTIEAAPRTNDAFKQKNGEATRRLTSSIVAQGCVHFCDSR